MTNIIITITIYWRLIKPKHYVYIINSYTNPEKKKKDIANFTLQMENRGTENSNSLFDII